jgi:hypothetical protein
MLAASIGAQSTEFRLSKDGVGPIDIAIGVDVEGRNTTLNASARNDTGVAITSARFCVQPESQEKACDFELWTTATRKAGEELKWKPLKGPARRPE